MSISFEDFPELFARITQAVHQRDDLDGLLADILVEIAGAFDACGCTLRVLEWPEGILRLRAAVGLSQAFLEKGEVRADPSLSEIFSDEPIVIADIPHDPRIQYPEAARREGITTVVGLPFPILDETRMVLRVYFKQPILPDSVTLNCLKALAGQGALAVRNALLHQRYVVTFRTISTAIHSGRGIDEILKRIVEQVTILTAARGAIYWILNTRDRSIVDRVTHGFDYRGLSTVDYAAIEQLFAPAEGRQVIIGDARNDDRIPSLERLGKKRVQTVLGLPFRIAEAYMGVMAVYFGFRKTFRSSEIDFLSALGEQGAIALQKALWFDESRLHSFQQTMEGLAVALEAKDGQTHGHSLRVAHLARLTAQAMGLPVREIDTIYRAGLLHDIGKIGTEDQVLAHLGSLEGDEVDHIRDHPEIGARILAPMADGAELVPMVRYHHERYDGSGYPEGRKGADIPFGARILAVCDVLDSMLSGRAGQPALAVPQAMQRLVFERGRQFDPQVIDAALKMLSERPDELAPPESSHSILARLRRRLGKTDAFARNLFRKFPSSF
jgi:putative nucleotidyltransferase with HDIG domain